MGNEIESERRPARPLRRQSAAMSMVVWILASLAGWATIVLLGLALF